uniref:Eukaryotic translation initiation factor 5B n=1 Tax=Eptatretus burgeri TaxID=7764 RepID=A0A8C4QZ68_EPTBU
MGKRQKGKAEVDGACKVDDVDNVEPVAEMEDSSMMNFKKSAPGKKAKKKKVKNEYDEDDILREMQELALETNNFGGASKKEEVKVVSSQDGQESDEECFARKSKKKMGGKNDFEQGMVEKNAICDGKNNNMENKRKQILSGDDKDAANDKKERAVKGGKPSNKRDSSDDEDTRKKGELKQERLLSDEDDIFCLLQVKKKKSGKKINSTEELTRRKQVLADSEPDSEYEKKIKKGKKAKNKKENKLESDEELPREKDGIKDSEPDSECEKKIKKGKKAKNKKENKLESDEELPREKDGIKDSEPDSECEKKIKKGKKAKNKKENKLDSDEELPREKDGLKDGADESEDEAEKTGMKTKKKRDQKLLEDNDEVSTVKTAAQKKAEKKERERKKREEERLKMKQRKEQEATKEVNLEKQIVNEVDILKPTEELNETLGDVKGADKDGEGDDAKKKKKKKAEKEEKPEKKKGPSKALVKAMQEALAKRREEEERLKQEEEERLRRIEEAEALLLEKERLEQERKERKKQKEKERKERLRKEGKLLTPSQRQAKARATATLRVLEAQGIEIPSKETVQKRKSMTDDRRRKQKRQHGRDAQSSSVEMTQELQVQHSGESLPVEVSQETIIKNEVVADEKEEEVEVEEEEEEEEEEEDEEGIADWEMIASDEENLKEDKQTTKTTERCVLERVVGQMEFEAGIEETEIYSEEEDDDVDAEGKGEEEHEESTSDEDSDFSNERTKEQQEYDVAKKRIEKRQAENAARVTTDNLRAPVICVLGHVDTGKTKLLDKLRHTNVQDGEAGGITQQIGATNVPLDAIKEQTRMVKDFDRDKIKLPGMLIIDTPGHESFSNLRNRGSSLCDMAILVVDIMHGLEPQTIESINLLKSKKCPFIIALNKIDRLYDWKRGSDSDVVFTIKKQKKNTKDEFDSRVNAVIAQFAEQHMNAALFYENKDQRTFVSMVPTSAHTGDGIGNIIALLVELTQTLLAKHICFSEELLAQVMEVKAIPGLGTTIDVILTNGCLREGATIVLAGVDGPIVTQVRGLLMPQPLKELRVKNQYERCKDLVAAQGVKIIAKDLEKTLAGLPLRVAYHDDEIAVLRDEVVNELKNTLNSIKLEEHGVYVQASTLGSLEALLEFLRLSRIPYAGINIGPVHKRDVMKASAMLEHDNQYAVILAFDVKVEREAQDMADYLGVKVFSADIIYHLFDSFMKYRADIRRKKQEEFRHIAVFPCKLRIMPQFVFKSRDPVVVGVNVEAGQLNPPP